MAISHQRRDGQHHGAPRRRRRRRGRGLAYESARL